MVTTQTAPNGAARSLVEFDADALRAVADAPGVVPSLRSALGALVDAAATAAADDENPFTDVAINGAALVESNQLALVVARGLIERLQADLNAAAIEQRTHLRDELARFEGMNLE
jgi:hypothetical protein